MKPEDRDAAHLWDMLEAAREALDFTEGVTLERFVADRKLRYAVERLLVIIGEAANHLSQPFKAAHPEIPWLVMVGQRNLLAHDYGEVREDRVWRMVRNELPRLVEVLEPLIPELP